MSFISFLPALFLNAVHNTIKTHFRKNILTLQVDDKVNFHFILFNNVDGHLYELGTFHSSFGI